jgi:hypothetical protein
MCIEISTATQPVLAAAWETMIVHSVKEGVAVFPIPIKGLESPLLAEIQWISAVAKGSLRTFS